MNKSVDIWVSINKNGFINMTIDKPERNTDVGKWTYKQSFVNSVIYNEIKQLVEHSHLTWESESEFLTIQLE